MKVNTLTVKFDGELSHREIPFFRGAVIACCRDRLGEADLCFHNHTEDGYNYRYPVIQYKIIRGKMSIVCVGDGTEAIGKLLAQGRLDLKIADRDVSVSVESVHPSVTEFRIWDRSDFKFVISKWLPLNSDNYKKYSAIDSLAEKLLFLENILKGNILSFAKGVGSMFDKAVECRITKISDPFFYKVKDTGVMGYNAEFRTNVSLPDDIGLGKHVSLGFGTVHRIKLNSKYEL